MGSQTRAVPSSLAVTTVRPSGLKRASLTAAPECIGVPTRRPLARSQTRAVPSLPAVTTSRPFGLNDTMLIEFACHSLADEPITLQCAGFAALATQTPYVVAEPGRPPANAIQRPSAEKAKSSIGPTDGTELSGANGPATSFAVDASQKRADPGSVFVPEPAVTTRRPSGAKRATLMPGSWSAPITAPGSGFHSRAVPSSLAVAICVPAALMLTALTPCW